MSIRLRLISFLAIALTFGGCASNYVAPKSITVDAISCNGQLSLVSEEEYGSFKPGTQLTGHWGLAYDPTQGVQNGKSTFYPSLSSAAVEFTDENGIQYDANVRGIVVTNGHSSAGWVDGVEVVAEMPLGAPVAGIPQTQAGAMSIQYLTRDDSIISSGDSTLDWGDWKYFGIVTAGLTNPNIRPERPELIIYPLILNTGRVNCRNTVITFP